MASKALISLALLFLSAVSSRPAFAEISEEDKPGLVMNFYKETCPQAEDIVKEQVKLLYKRHQITAVSWLINFFHDCAVQSCDASLHLNSTRRSLSEKETNLSFRLRNFRYFDTIKEAVERECPGVVSCADILVLSARDGIVALGGPHIPLKTGRRDGRKAHVVEQRFVDHNDYISDMLDRGAAMGIDTPGIVALQGGYGVARTQVKHMLDKCPDAMNYRGPPMVLDNYYYRNILDSKGLFMGGDHEFATDERTKPYVKKMAKSQDYFFKEFARAITILSENNPLTGDQGEIRKQCNAANKHH